MRSDFQWIWAIATIFVRTHFRGKDPTIAHRSTLEPADKGVLLPKYASWFLWTTYAHHQDTRVGGKDVNTFRIAACEPATIETERDGVQAADSQSTISAPRR